MVESWHIEEIHVIRAQMSLGAGRAARAKRARHIEEDIIDVIWKSI